MTAPNGTAESTTTYYAPESKSMFQAPTGLKQTFVDGHQENNRKWQRGTSSLPAKVLFSLSQP